MSIPNKSNLKIVEVPGDGNCLLHAIIYNSGKKDLIPFNGNVQEARTAIVDRLFVAYSRNKDHPVFCSNCSMSKTYEKCVSCQKDEDLCRLIKGNSTVPNIYEYLEIQGKDGAWLGIDAISAAADILNRNINLYRPSGYCESITWTGYPDSKQPMGDPILIYFNGLNHFNAVVDQSTHGSTKDKSKSSVLRDSKIEKRTEKKTGRSNFISNCYSDELIAMQIQWELNSKEETVNDSNLDEILAHQIQFELNFGENGDKNRADKSKSNQIEKDAMIAAQLQWDCNRDNKQLHVPNRCVLNQIEGDHMLALKLSRQ